MDAARRLGVSAHTLDAWTSRGLLPTVKVDRYARQRVPLQPLLALVAEVDTLREQGRKRGLLVEALARLEAEDEYWREEIAPLLAVAGRPFDRAEYVPAGRPDWHPED